MLVIVIDNKIVNYSLTGQYGRSTILNWFTDRLTGQQHPKNLTQKTIVTVTLKNTKILEKLLSACWKHFESPYLYRTYDYCDQGNLYIRWNERHLSNSLQRQHVYSTLKWHGNGRFHVVSAWNTSGVFVGLFWNTNDSIASFSWLKYVNLWERQQMSKTYCNIKLDVFFITEADTDFCFTP